MTSRQERRIKLIRPALQMRLVGCFLTLTTVALVLQFLVLWRSLARAASEIETAGGPLTEHLPPMLLGVLGTCLAVVLPVILGFGILLTFRIAGPVHRLEQFLAAVARGEQVEPCRLRADDELQELCELVNAATAGEREQTCTPGGAAEREDPGLEPSARGAA